MTDSKKTPKKSPAKKVVVDDGKGMPSVMMELLKTPEPQGVQYKGTGNYYTLVAEGKGVKWGINISLDTFKGAKLVFRFVCFGNLAEPPQHLNFRTHGAFTTPDGEQIPGMYFDKHEVVLTKSPINAVALSMADAQQKISFQLSMWVFNQLQKEGLTPVTTGPDIEHMIANLWTGAKQSEPLVFQVPPNIFHEPKVYDKPKDKSEGSVDDGGAGDEA